MDQRFFITDSSTHIERMWNDVYKCLGQIFHHLLYNLENNGFIGPLINYINLFCVNFAILPEINHSLAEFVHSWNHHPLPTALNLTPEQFYVIGMIERQDRQRNTASSFNTMDPTAFNVNIQLDETESVIVPVTPSNIGCIHTSNYATSKVLLKQKLILVVNCT